MIDSKLAAVEQLVETSIGQIPVSIDKIPESGSDRIYYRVFLKDNQTLIATFNKNIKENETFINFSNHFKERNCPVPRVFFYNPDKSIYLQEDLGTTSLLNILEQEGYTQNVYELFKKSLKNLAYLQIKGSEDFNYSWCITSQEFGKQALISDLLYFKYYFVDFLKIQYDKEKLGEDFDALATYLSRADYRYFMFRDFQSRNVMIKDNDAHFIDFQGGMRGAIQYDVASLLWQAKAKLNEEWKNTLLDHYITCVEDLLNQPVDRNSFISQYNGYVIIRLLQVLGAYGLRGLFERKAHFVTSIPMGLQNLRWFLDNKKVGLSLPELEKVLNAVTTDEIIKRFTPTLATKDSKLIVKIKSFSYKKTGYPKDETENGGGFVFDCRGILNPGRFDEYKALTGRDKPVKDFLEQQTKMNEFLNNIYNTVDITVEDYLKRDFDSLNINFGCTGGQHRSVYAAEQLARHLRNKFKVKIDLQHLEQNIHETFNF